MRSRTLLLCVCVATALLAASSGASEAELNDTKFTLRRSSFKLGDGGVARSGDSAASTSSTAKNASIKPSLKLLTDSSWTNTMLEQWLCGNMTEEARFDFQIFPIGPAPLLELPACFYPLASTLESIYLSGIIIQGSETITDPLERLAKSLSATVSVFTLVNSKALTFNGESTSVDVAMLSRLMPTASIHVDMEEAKATATRRVDAQITVTPLDSWTNASFESNACANLGAATTSFTVVQGTATLPFLLPACFYTKSNGITNFDAVRLIVQGNSTQPDPLGRLAKALSAGVTLFSLTQSFILTDTGANATINWTTFAPITATVNQLSFSGTQLGPGAVFPVFSRRIPIIDLSLVGLNATLPSSMYTSAATNPTNTLNLRISSNSLYGPIPATFFGNYDLQNSRAIVFAAETNFLTSVSFGLFSGPLTLCTSVTVTLDSNQLEGSLSDIFANATFPPTKMLYFYVTANSNSKLSGGVPTWLTSVSTLVSYTLKCTSCRLQGALPPTFFSSMTGPSPTFNLYLENNQLSGAIPSKFLNFPNSPTALQLRLTNNSLSAIPSDLFDLANFTKTTGAITVALDSNKLNGNLPTSAGLFGSTIPNYAFSVAVNPTLTGTVPASFLASFGTVASTSTSLISINFSVSKLTGTFALPDLSLAPKLMLYIIAAFCDFDTFLPNAANSSLLTLSLDNNTRLTGEFSTSFLQVNPLLSHFTAAYTRLSGDMPNMGVLDTTKLQELDLTDTLIDFCSTPRATWTSSSLTSCSLLQTTAFDCPGYYPSLCSVSAPPPPSAPIAPTNPPIDPPAPVLAPVPAPIGCSASTRPSADFNCIDGAWTFVGSVESTVITIPSGATTTNIKGNLTSTTVIINGLNSLLSVDGCTANVTILIELTPEQLKAIGSDGTLQQLLIYSNDSSCDSSLSDVALSTKVKGSSCKKVSVRKQPSSDGTLSGLFSVDKSGCSKWWIILVAVIAAIVVLVAIFVLLAVFVPAIRNCIRPYSKRQAKPQNLN